MCSFLTLIAEHTYKIPDETTNNKETKHIANEFTVYNQPVRIDPTNQNKPKTISKTLKAFPLLSLLDKSVTALSITD